MFFLDRARGRRRLLREARLRVDEDVREARERGVLISSLSNNNNNNNNNNIAIII